jgi:glycosyltransferase involved in cell wall biosynthesis
MTSPRDLPIVVVGGYEYSPDMNQPATVTVRELARTHRVLNLHSEAHGSLLGRLRGRARQLSLADTVRTAVGPTRVRRVEERLWLAPVRGLAAIGPLSTPEPMRRHNVRVFGTLIRRWLADRGARECLLWFYWWALPELVGEVPHAASLYDCTDDHAALPGSIVAAATVRRLEGRLLDAVDRSYVVSSGLLEARAGPGRRISVLPNGFDVTLFRRIERAGFAAPVELGTRSRPVVGYAGGINRRLDWELLTALARRRPEWTFAFVGGDARYAPAAVRRAENVVFVHALPYRQALAVISRFDVATIPVCVSDFSRGNSFLKLLDYFAHGTPVVATPLPATIEVAQAEAGLLWLAEDVEGWLAALTAALHESPSSPARAARRRFVEARSVSRRVARMLGDALGHDGAHPAADPWASGAAAAGRVSVSSPYRSS